MSLSSYLNDDEEIKLQTQINFDGQIGEKEDSRKIGDLVLTTRRIIEFTHFKNNIEYRDIPLDKISYIEHEWQGRRMALIIIGAILIAIGAILIIYDLTNIYSYSFNTIFSLPIYFLLGMISLAIGIPLLIIGLKQYGYLLINNKEWKFIFKEEEGINFVKNFIKQVYFLI